MKNNELIKYKGDLVNRVGNTINITNKLLSSLEPQLIPYRKREKWGFCSPDKKIMIDLVFDNALPFQENLAPIKINGVWGFINKLGEIIIEPQFYYADFFTEGLAKVKVNWNSKYGFIDTKGLFVIPELFWTAFAFSNGNSCVSINGQYGYIGKDGQFTISCSFDDAFPFHEGMAAIKLNKKWGFINTLGNIAIKCNYDEVNSFSEGWASFLLNDKIGFINKAGEIVINNCFERSISFGGNCDNYIYREDEISLSHGLINIEIEKYKFGYYDRNLNQVINPIYKHTSPFSYNLGRVSLEVNEVDYETAGAINMKIDNELFGYVDIKGNLKIPCKYEYANSFKNKLALVSTGYINSDGTEFWED